MREPNPPVPHRARKRFGQHFLHDPGVIQRLVDAVRPRPGDRLVEIGPGTGALTLPLLRTHGALEAIELDRDLIPRLQAAAEGLGTLTIHEADALRFDYRACHSGSEPLRIVGNLPYNISTPLLFHLLGQTVAITDLHLMLQLEVVQRLEARPGSRTFGRLSVMVQYQCDVETLFRVGSGAFQPPPAVESAVVRLRIRPPGRTAREPALFARLVAAGFGQRRKTLRRSLSGLVEEANFRMADIDPGARAEALTVDQWVQLANACADVQGDETDGSRPQLHTHTSVRRFQ